jgi:hypothetical protein
MPRSKNVENNVKVVPSMHVAGTFSPPTMSGLLAPKLKPEQFTSTVTCCPILSDNVFYICLHRFLWLCNILALSGLFMFLYFRGTPTSPQPPFFF